MRNNDNYGHINANLDNESVEHFPQLIQNTRQGCSLHTNVLTGQHRRILERLWGHISSEDYIPESLTNLVIWPTLSSPDQQHTGSSQKPALASTIDSVKRLFLFSLVF